MAQLSLKKITPLFLSLLAGFAVVPFVFPQTTKAQSLDQDPSQDFQRQQNPRDPFGGSSSGQNFTPLDLIHRANFGDLRSEEEFSTEQRNSLDEAAAEFKVKQKERLQNPLPNQAAPGNSTNPGNAIIAPSQNN